MTDILTSQEAADEMRVHEKTVRRMILRGDLPAVKVGRGYRIRREDLPTSQKPKTPPRRRYRPRGSIGRVVAEMEAAS